MSLVVNYFCIYCMTPLRGKQKKYCSEKCRKKVSIKKWKQKKWRLINAKIKTKKIIKKTRRKILIEQEEIKREKLNASLC